MTSEQAPEHLDAHAAALDSITDEATSNHAADPKAHLHLPATHPMSHEWLSRYLPASSLSTSEGAKARIGSLLTSKANEYHYGNYVIDRKTKEKTFEEVPIYVRVGMHLLYYGNHQAKMLHVTRVQGLLEQQSVKMGKAYDAPDSKAHIWPFIKSFQLEKTLIQLKEPDPDRYPTFNHFFARALRHDARPVEDAHNVGLVCSPADCRLTAFPSVDLATKYWIKGQGFTLGKLLGSDEKAAKYDGGSIIIARLAPQDYHRWHSPVNGTIQSIDEIPGAYYTVNPQAINEDTTLDVFCENRRSVMEIKRKETGSTIAIIAVGAMLVGSVKYDEGIVPGKEIERGQGLGAFYYGGSTVIVLYPKNEIVLDADLVSHSTTDGCETLMRVGWRTGESNP